MIINVNKDKITINENYYINQGEININELVFNFSSEYNGLVKKAIFKNTEKAVEKTIFNNKCTIPPEVLTEDRIELRIYAYDSNMNLRYSPTFIVINVEKGSYIEGTIPEKVITPSQFEQYEAELIKGLTQAQNINIESVQTESGADITTFDRNGKAHTVSIQNGERGPQGEQGPVGPTPDLTDYVKNTDYATDNTGGVIKRRDAFCFGVDNSGLPYSTVKNFNDYNSLNNASFISKGTLENVITGKQLTDKTYVDGLVGDIETALTALDVGNGVV